ncbi:glutaredoxin domain protein region [Leptolyngbya boryana NIES-2135]|jgi:glutaredoxin-like protein|uniref:Glutaredoxin domain protein region n=1 Tax=Leptolyngbya boryana NIES-2135 TaxID=1973484 RepID=A0A1Z4JCV6_LEPBY|nr:MULTISPECIES: glutathione peroxidase [Leptolyngbya]BAY54592.1 glutaredoxin domain protein region [Leptolyngbya boryana NIES-2135]MBD1859819.1 glutathione peroxidase [Leptolyngbya sp. FACHB-1624]MBD2365584.1 glutathione peroxidase [Leptolyngbya sp. FACHB-161]MBD2371764.1 glutathione peroxidase [Leptolyngbya sp. FACHB-238]MBD2396189.1 glutathione peroxidase [Leptolyngbya sp. FACHB-239]
MAFVDRSGQKVPDVTFRTRENNEWVSVTAHELFAGKTVIVFSLPGAFTPTCSSTHVPGYNELAKVFKANGVDDIVCISVNDAFVMNEWCKDQNADYIRMIPDGNGEFTDGMGMLVDKSDLGFGKRSWRYSMLVKDGTIEKMFIEPEEPGDPFKVSDADTMLKYINETAEKPKAISLFTKIGCPFCAKAKQMLSDRGFDYEEIVLGRDASPRTLRAVTGASTVPQVFVEGNLIGGSEDLAAYLGAN